MVVTMIIDYSGGSEDKTSVCNVRDLGREERKERDYTDRIGRGKENLTLG